MDYGHGESLSRSTECMKTLPSRKEFPGGKYIGIQNLALNSGACVLTVLVHVYLHSACVLTVDGCVGLPSR